jgi:ATP-dependent RNA circularization protein (DNA/RNA ligase family)
MSDFEFQPWPKISRLKTNIVTVTEKIDGTNACVVVKDGKVVGAQSRNKIITRTDDNMGFANWVWDNQEVLATLGEGYHYGEWAGPGIQKNPHCLDKKYFFLFDTRRWDYLEHCEAHKICRIVPKIYIGDFATVEELCYPEEPKTVLIKEGVANGNEDSNPEGFMYYFHAFRTHLKAPIREADK